MKCALLLVWCVAIGSAAAAQPLEHERIRDADALCASLLAARQVAESQGRLDFSVTLEAAETADPIEVTTHVTMGPPYSVGRINFTGHHGINDSTLRRALTLRERDVFDVGKLRRSLSRLNEIGLAEPLSLEDVVVTRHAHTASADVTIPLRERRGRWWSVSGPIVPGLGSYQASISSRLPAWGRGIFDASTYYVTFNSWPRAAAASHPAAAVTLAGRHHRARAAVPARSGVALRIRGVAHALAPRHARALRTHTPHARGACRVGSATCGRVRPTHR